MLVLIPHLFPSARMLETAVQGLHVPALETLAARGKIRACPKEGVEAGLCEAMGIKRQQDWPLAPITLEADGWPAGATYWLRADPVHLHVMRDRVVLAGSQELNLAPQEASALASTISQHFGEDFRPIPHHPDRWYVPLKHPPRLVTTPLSLARGCDIEPLLPQGEDALHYRTLLNELQMLLFAHPANQAREAHGELAVNSVWLWGGGILPARPARRIPLFARDSEARAIGLFCRTPVLSPVSRFEKSTPEAGGITVLDDLAQPGQRGEAFGWREALTALESSWFGPLLRSLHTLGPEGLSLRDPVKGKELNLQRADALKVWKRARGLTPIVA